MLGLVLNNFYLIMYNLKTNIVISVSLLAGYVFFNVEIFLFMAILVVLVMIPCTAFSTVRDAKVSKWDLVEKQMPVKKRSIVISKYIAFILLLILAVVTILSYVEMFGVKLDMTLHPKISGLRTMTVEGLIRICITEAILMCMLYFPLAYSFDAKNPDLVLTISVGASIVVVKIIQNMGVEVEIALLAIGLLLSGYASCMIQMVKNKE